MISEMAGACFHISLSQDALQRGRSATKGKMLGRLKGARAGDRDSALQRRRMGCTRTRKGCVLCLLPGTAR